MYTCIIVDDEEIARNLIKNHVSQLDNFKIVALCESAIEASKVLQQQQVDLLFLDIEMPVLRGTDFFKGLLQKPNVIFTTAYRDYAIDGFELNAIDYLLKPITFHRFFRAIEKFLAQQPHTKTTEIKSIPSPSTQNYVYVRKDRKQVKVLFDDVLYIESIKDYIKIHLTDTSHITKHSLTAFASQLDSRFLRVHRSYIVNKDKITAYTKQDIEIHAIEIPIGESYRAVVTELV